MEPKVNDSCRFCNIRLRNDAGTLQHSTQIFEKKRNPREQNIFQRLQGLDLTLKERRDRSSRSCVKCENLVKRLESALPFFRKWEEDEKEVALRSQQQQATPRTTATVTGPVATTSAQGTTRPPETMLGHGPPSADTAATSAQTETFRRPFSPALASASPTPSSTGSTSSTSDKRPVALLTPTKSPGDRKKMRQTPPTPTRHTPGPARTSRKSLTEVKKTM